MSKIYHKITRDILFENDSLSMKELVRINKKNLSECDLSNIDLSGLNLENADLECADLTNTNLDNVNLCDANLRKTILARSSLIRANLEWADLYWSDLTKTNLCEANLYQTNLKRVELKEIFFERVILENTDLKGALINNKEIINFKEIGKINDKGILRCFLLKDNSFYFMFSQFYFRGTEQELKKEINKYTKDYEYAEINEAIEYLKNLSTKYKGE